MKFCPNCASTLSLKIPADDSRERFVCDSCGTIHYQNPRNVVGSIPVYGEQVLLCRRAIAPRHGYWTLPAGFMELGESTAEGAGRETVEEAGAEFTMGPLLSVMSVPRVGQVHLYYLAELRHEEFNPGFETQEARMFLESEIPWDELAFRTVQETLKHYFADKKSGQFQVHSFNID